MSAKSKSMAGFVTEYVADVVTIDNFDIQTLHREHLDPNNEDLLRKMISRS